MVALAFPGAEGFGRNALGGRGPGTPDPVVYVVNTLADSGAGSLREAVEASGPRFVTFSIGGTIILNTRLNFQNPYITIAGQTAPGGGICLRNSTGANRYPLLEIWSHDIVVRYLRLRNDPDVTPGDEQEPIAFGSTAHDVIIDHCSCSWGTDSSIDVAGYNITIQWCILSESLQYSTHAKTIANGDPHSMGMGIFQLSGGVSIHHNLFAHNQTRNPHPNGGQTDFVNNLLYNVEGYGSGGNRSPCHCLVHSDLSINFVGNYHKVGPESASGIASFTSATGPANLDFYVSGNIDPNRTSDSQAENLVILPVSIRSLSNPNRIPMPLVHTTTAFQAYVDVLANAGAMLPVRDSVDARLVADVENGTGSWIDDPSEVGGHPTLAAGTPLLDTDGDGMPDAWEDANGLDKTDASDNITDLNVDGYLNIEEYLNNTDVGEIPTGSGSVAVSVNSSSDDAEEFNTTGAVNLTSIEFELGNDPDPQIIGTRFNNVLIPQGASIISASVQFTANLVKTSTPFDITIYGEAADDAATFTTANGNISGRTKTVSSVAWVVPPWDSVDEAGADQQTYDISSIVQEIVNRLGWSSGNSLCILYDSNINPARHIVRSSYSYDADPAKTAVFNCDFGTYERSLIDFGLGTESVPGMLSTFSVSDAGFGLETYTLSKSTISPPSSDLGGGDLGSTDLGSGDLGSGNLIES